MHIRIAIALALLALGPSVATAQTPNAQLGSDMQAKKVDPAKEKAIRNLFEVTHTARALLEGMKSNLETQKQDQSNATIPAVFWDEVIKRAEADLGVFLTTLVGIYDQHYTKEEIDQMVAFYKTPLGQMMANKAPPVALATAAAAERWGMKLGMTVMMELLERGLVKP